MTGTVFDLRQGIALRDGGIDACVANGRAEVLELARELARNIARDKGHCTADDVFLALGCLGYAPSALGCAAGALFRGREWVWLGRMVNSHRASNHGRMIKVWEPRK